MPKNSENNNYTDTAQTTLKRLGNTGEKVCAIGIGTWRIRDYSKAEQTLLRAVQYGINLIDTAEMYGDGKAEEMVGRVIKQVGRDQVFVTTKILPRHFADKDEAVDAARKSVKRLGVNHTDLILIHWPESYATITQQMSALEAMAENGLTRYIGVSNFSPDELEEAMNSTKRHDIVANQVKYSVLDSRVEDEGLVDFCNQNKVTIQAYTPLEDGKVSKNKTIKEIAAKYQKTPVQVALNYLISNPFVTALPKTETPDRVDGIAGCMGWSLEKQDLNLLKQKAV